MGNGDPPGVIFGRRVREERMRRGWRLADLAAAAAKLGVTLHLSAYAKTEAGEREPRIGEAVVIAEALGVPLGALLVDSSDIEAEAERLGDQARTAAAEAEAAWQRAAQYSNEQRRIILGYQEES